MNEADGLPIKNRIYTFFDTIFNIEKSDKIGIDIIEITHESIYEEFFLPLIDNDEVAAEIEDYLD